MRTERQTARAARARSFRACSAWILLVRASMQRNRGNVCVAECASIFHRLAVFRLVPSALLLRSSSAVLSLQTAVRRMLFARAQSACRLQRMQSPPKPMQSWLVGHASTTLRVEDSHPPGRTTFQSVHGGVPTSSHPGGVELSGPARWPPLESEW